MNPLDLSTAPGMPPLGQGFPLAMETAGFHAGQQRDFICHMLTNPTDYELCDKKTGSLHVTMIPGHALDGPRGPRPADVMVIGKMPGAEENQLQRYFVGPSGQEFRRHLQSFGADPSAWYATNVCRFLPPGRQTTLKATWVKECAHFLFQEIQIVKPKFILLLGADAVKALFPGESLKRVRGAFIRKNGAHVFATVNPAAVLRKPEMMPGFMDDLRLFVETANRGAPPKPQPTQYWYIDNQERLDSAVDQLVANGVTHLAMDCEWAGRDFKTGTLRSIQMSWAPGRALVIRLRDDNQKECFSPNRFAALSALKRLIYRPGVKIIGHYFRADLPWLVEFGLTDLIKYFHFDTMLVNHLLQENAQHDLNSLVMRFSDLGRYDLELKNWIKEHYPKGLDEFDGYGTIPDRILLPYAARDADGTFRAYAELDRQLNDPANKELRKLYYDVVHNVTEAILEIEMSGLHADPDRMRRMSFQYADKRNELVTKLRAGIGDDAFNFRSPRQVQTLLFDKLGLTPIKTTKAHDFKAWGDFERELGKDITQASTDRESLGILATQNPNISAINRLRDIKFIDQICKNFLRPPTSVGDHYSDENDEQFTDGLISLVHKDQRIRSRISQLTTTGRWRSFDPNLQNIPKRRERDYDRIFSGVYVPKLRSCFTARPGYVLVEADYVQAELFVLAWISRDYDLLKVLSTPGRDLHSETAKKMFQLDCFIGLRDGKMVDEVKERYEGLRVAAKTVNFGIPYQRGAEAIAREVLQEGVQITIADARAGIDGFYEMYPMVRPYVDECGRMAVEDGYIRNPYGRRRRFPYTADEKLRAAYKREACNFPIQSTVADTLSRACANIINYRKHARPGGEALDYRLVLAIHDAVMLEVRADHVEHVANHVLPLCLRDQAVIPELGTKLDIDVSLGLRWGEEATKKNEKGLKVIEQLIDMGVSESLFAA